MLADLEGADLRIPVGIDLDLGVPIITLLG
jgi:hypothetical protein